MASLVSPEEVSVLLVLLWALLMRALLMRALLIEGSAVGKRMPACLVGL